MVCFFSVIIINDKLTMKTRSLILSISLILTLSFSSTTSNAHCEIPCGIYGDSLRITLVSEHIKTIEKSMNEIIELSTADEINYNQLIRWVSNKEEHAEKIQEIVSQYFLHQRIKIADPSEVEAYAKYNNQLSLLHQLLVYSMKAKQTTDLEYIQKLKETLNKFSDSYFHTH